MNTTLLRVLLVEDSEDDALLTLHELRKGGFQTEWERVDTRAAMELALASRSWELVICDHVMPGFSSAGALDVMRKGSLDLPFIIVSGVAPEDLVTAAMRQGAHDFISKGNLVRLVPAVKRELKEAALRRDRLQNEVTKSTSSITAQFNLEYFDLPSQPDIFLGVTLASPPVSRAGIRTAMAP